MMRNIKTRDGFEFWDKLNALPRYAFLLSPSGKSVQKFEDQAMGNWIDVHEAQKIVDQAEERISERQDELGESARQLEKFRSRSHGIKNLSAIEERDDQLATAQLKINDLQQRLNVVDQRADDLAEMLALASVSVDYHAGIKGEDGGHLYNLLTRIRAVFQSHVEQPLGMVSQARTDQLRGAAKMIDAPHPEPIKGMIETVGGEYAVMIDLANGHYGWTFWKHPDGHWVSGRKATEREMIAARSHAKITNQL